MDAWTFTGLSLEEMEIGLADTTPIIHRLTTQTPSNIIIRRLWRTSRQARCSLCLSHIFQQLICLPTMNIFYLLIWYIAHFMFNEIFSPTFFPYFPCEQISSPPHPIHLAKPFCRSPPCVQFHVSCFSNSKGTTYRQYSSHFPLNSSVKSLQ